MKNMFMLVFQSMKLLVMSFVAVIIGYTKFIKHRNDDDVVRVIEIGTGKIEEVVPKYGAALGNDLDTKYLLAIRWFFSLYYKIPDIWEYLESKNIKFVSVDKYDTICAAAFNMQGNRIILVNEYKYKNGCSTLVHEIQHALQFHKYGTLKTSHGFVNFMARCMMTEFNNNEIYLALPYEKDSINVQAKYEDYFDNLFDELYADPAFTERFIKTRY